MLQRLLSTHSLLRVRVEQGLYKALAGQGEQRPHVVAPVQPPLADVGQDLRVRAGGRGVERVGPAQHDEEDNAKGPHVDGGGARLPLDDLRSPEVESSPVYLHLKLSPLLPRHPEVAQLHVGGRVGGAQQDVLRLHVPVDELPPVQVEDRARNLQHVVARQRLRQLPMPHNVIKQRSSVRQRHHREPGILRLAHALDRDEALV
mmetsp:Transcript_13296/g.46451  ORF Transcript_13296/g.46451 Transcript_13296/m.46451 type:complete len:203 (-) Transcript_13296:745-1353(-)